MSELGRCTNAEATFPLPSDTRPVDGAPDGLYESPPPKPAICFNELLMAARHKEGYN